MHRPTHTTQSALQKSALASEDTSGPRARGWGEQGHVQFASAASGLQALCDWPSWRGRILPPACTPGAPASKGEPKRQQPDACQEKMGRVGEEGYDSGNTKEQAQDRGAVPKKEGEEAGEHGKDATHDAPSSARLLTWRPWLSGRVRLGYRSALIHYICFIWLIHLVLAFFLGQSCPGLCAASTLSRMLLSLRLPTRATYFPEISSQSSKASPRTGTSHALL